MSQSSGTELAPERQLENLLQKAIDLIKELPVVAVGSADNVDVESLTRIQVLITQLNTDAVPRGIKPKLPRRKRNSAADSQQEGGPRPERTHDSQSPSNQPRESSSPEPSQDGRPAGGDPDPEEEEPQRKDKRIQKLVNLFHSWLRKPVLAPAQLYDVLTKPSGLKQEEEEQAAIIRAVRGLPWADSKTWAEMFEDVRLDAPVDVENLLKEALDFPRRFTANRIISTVITRVKTINMVMDWKLFSGLQKFQYNLKIYKILFPERTANLSTPEDEKAFYQGDEEFRSWRKTQSNLITARNRFFSIFINLHNPLQSQYGAITLMDPAWDLQHLTVHSRSEDYQAYVTAADTLPPATEELPEGEDIHPLSILQPAIDQAVLSIIETIGGTPIAAYVYDFLESVENDIKIPRFPHQLHDQFVAIDAATTTITAASTITHSKSPALVTCAKGRIGLLKTLGSQVPSPRRTPNPTSTVLQDVVQAVTLSGHDWFADFLSNQDHPSFQKVSLTTLETEVFASLGRFCDSEVAGSKVFVQSQTALQSSIEASTVWADLPGGDCMIASGVQNVPHIPVDFRASRPRADGYWGPHEYTSTPMPFDPYSPYLAFIETPPHPDLRNRPPFLTLHTHHTVQAQRDETICIVNLQTQSNIEEVYLSTLATFEDCREGPPSSSDPNVHRILQSVKPPLPAYLNMKLCWLFIKYQPRLFYHLQLVLAAFQRFVLELQAYHRWRQEIARMGQGQKIATKTPLRGVIVDDCRTFHNFSHWGIPVFMRLPASQRSNLSSAKQGALVTPDDYSDVISKFDAQPDWTREKSFHGVPPAWYPPSVENPREFERIARTVTSTPYVPYNPKPAYVSLCRAVTADLNASPLFPHHVADRDENWVDSLFRERAEEKGRPWPPILTPHQSAALERIVESLLISAQAMIPLSSAVLQHHRGPPPRKKDKKPQPGFPRAMETAHEFIRQNRLEWYGQEHPVWHSAWRDHCFVGRLAMLYGTAPPPKTPFPLPILVASRSATKSMTMLYTWFILRHPTVNRIRFRGESLEAVSHDPRQWEYILSQGFFRSQAHQDLDVDSKFWVHDDGSVLNGVVRPLDRDIHPKLSETGQTITFDVFNSSPKLQSHVIYDLILLNMQAEFEETDLKLAGARDRIHQPTPNFFRFFWMWDGCPNLLDSDTSQASLQKFALAVQCWPGYPTVLEGFKFDQPGLDQELFSSREQEFLRFYYNSVFETLRRVPTFPHTRIIIIVQANKIHPIKYPKHQVPIFSSTLISDFPASLMASPFTSPNIKSWTIVNNFPHPPIIHSSTLSLTLCSSPSLALALALNPCIALTLTLSDLLSLDFALNLWISLTNIADLGFLAILYPSTNIIMSQTLAAPTTPTPPDHHPSVSAQPAPQQCPDCHEPIKGNIATHKRTRHQQSASAKYRFSGGASVSLSVERVDGTFTCLYCPDRKYENASAFTAHAKACLKAATLPPPPDLLPDQPVVKTITNPCIDSEEHLDEQEEDEPSEQQEQSETAERSAQVDIDPLDTRFPPFHPDQNTVTDDLRLNSAGLVVNTAFRVLVCLSCYEEHILQTCINPTTAAKHARTQHALRHIKEDFNAYLLTAYPLLAQGPSQPMESVSAIPGIPVLGQPTSLVHFCPSCHRGYTNKSSYRCHKCTPVPFTQRMGLTSLQPTLSHGQTFYHGNRVHIFPVTLPPLNPSSPSSGAFFKFKASLPAIDAPSDEIVIPENYRELCQFISREGWLSHVEKHSWSGLLSMVEPPVEDKFADLTTLTCEYLHGLQKSHNDVVFRVTREFTTLQDMLNNRGLPPLTVPTIQKYSHIQSKLLAFVIRLTEESIEGSTYNVTLPPVLKTPATRLAHLLTLRSQSVTDGNAARGEPPDLAPPRPSPLDLSDDGPGHDQRPAHVNDDDAEDEDDQEPPEDAEVFTSSSTRTRFRIRRTDAEEDSREVTRIHQAIDDLIYALVTHTTADPNNKYYTPIYRFLVLASMRRNKLWIPASQITQIISALIFYFHHVLLERAIQHSIRTGQPILQLIPQYTSPIRENYLMPAANLLTLQHMFKALGSTEEGFPMFTAMDFSGDNLLFKGHVLTKAKYKSFADNLYESAYHLLSQGVLFGRFDDEMMNWRTQIIHETMPCRDVGYCFLDDPHNPFLAVKDKVLTLMLEDPILSRRFSYTDSQGNIILKPSSCFAWLDIHDECLLHITLATLYTQGHNARLEELCSHLLRNVSGGSVRNVHIYNQVFTLIGTYFKASGLTGRDNVVARTPSIKIGNLFVTLLAYSREAVACLTTALVDETAGRRARNYLFPGRHRPFFPQDLSDFMARKTLDHFGVEIRPREQRHINDFHSNTNGFVLHPTCITTSQFHLQSGHGGHVASRLYAQDRRMPEGIPEECVFRSMFASAQWQLVFGYDDELSLKMGKNPRFGIQVPAGASNGGSSIDTVRLGIDIADRVSMGLTTVIRQESRLSLAAGVAELKDYIDTIGIGLEHSTSATGPNVPGPSKKVTVTGAVYAALKMEMGPDAEFKIPEQAQATQALVDSKYDVLYVAPTGSGKTLPHQLACKHFDKGRMTVIVLPLQALHEEFVERATDAKISRVTWKHSTPPTTQHSLVFVPVENAPIKPFVSWALTHAKCGNLARVVVDEAHLLLTHAGFRSVMEDLWVIRTFGVQIVLLTATMPPYLVPALWQTVGSKAHLTIRAPTCRPEISYRVIHCHSKAHVFDKIAEHVRTTPLKTRETGIVFCHSKSDAERLSQHLKVPCVHAGLPKDERDAICVGWKAAVHPWIVSTSVLDCGVDNKHVRFVLHCGRPATPINIVQQGGRGGRDGVKSFSITFHSNKIWIPAYADPEDLFGVGIMADWVTDDELCRRIRLTSFNDGDPQPKSCFELGKGTHLCDNCDKQVASQLTVAPCQSGRLVDVDAVSLRQIRLNDGENPIPDSPSSPPSPSSPSNPVGQLSTPFKLSSKPEHSSAPTPPSRRQSQQSSSEEIPMELVDDHPQRSPSEHQLLIDFASSSHKASSSRGEPYPANPTKYATRKHTPTFNNNPKKQRQLYTSNRNTIDKPTMVPEELSFLPSPPKTRAPPPSKVKDKTQATLLAPHPHSEIYEVVWLAIQRLKGSCALCQFIGNPCHQTSNNCPNKRCNSHDPEYKYIRESKRFPLPVGICWKCGIPQKGMFTNHSGMTQPIHPAPVPGGTCDSTDVPIPIVFYCFKHTNTGSRTLFRKSMGLDTDENVFGLDQFGQWLVEVDESGLPNLVRAFHWAVTTSAFGKTLVQRH
ncbi:hypothetical protein JAAARDRAFT_51811 [Jaapia argillacea MUCL 33604]|uniref:DNA 3'-5' helicase n=1 Tax=Jaapia argillacea MUCL 33604 TaxID=933084 RepID=A0A067P5Y9_9AGAM|nr:hypothetical protein JAAARDRAFT_51811 [Jaapia argillacea MUCL 33604]